MIKRYFRYFLTFIVIGLGIINFSFASPNLYNNLYVRQNNLLGFSPYDNSYDIEGLKLGNVLTNKVGLGKSVLYLRDGTYFLWKYSSELGGVFPFLAYSYTNRYGVQYKQGFPYKYGICDYFSGQAIGDYTLSGCSVSNMSSSSFDTIKNFMSNVGLTDYIGFKYATANYTNDTQYNTAGLMVCFSSETLNKSMCFGIGNAVYGKCGLFEQNDDKCGFSGYDVSLSYDFDELNSWDFSMSPAGNNNFDGSGDNTFSSGNVVSIDIDIDDYIEYYETRFGWNERMCYVGTFNLTGSYDDAQIDFYPGSGDTIYGLYYNLYSGFGNNKIKNVGTFINTWLINYGQRFDTVDDDKLYLANYNGPDTSISLYYTGFTNPFSGKPAVIRYMAYNLYNYYSVESTQGEEMIYYCDMKLNYDNYKDGTLNFDELKDSVTPGINKRVKDYVNNQLGKSPDGYQYPSSGSVFDNLINSGHSIPSDLSPSKLFGDYYSKIDGLLRGFNPVTGTGLIPRRILYPMLFLVLFRIFKH